ncbi:SCO6745 family protein [Mycobacterium sp. 23]|uniref:SCO6745 family protein n=1 Tax=Mycobacterium sp. 23 TaxID=3400424 RepID=UPI003AAF958C
MQRTPALARHLYDRFEPIHALTYFAPEVRTALDGLGYRGFWMGYFAARSAPLGAVAPQVVTAVFYNFAHARVAKSLPAAWQIAGPDSALRARQDSTVAALRRCGVTDDENVSTAAELACRTAQCAPVDGRSLFAANVALPVPSDPVAALWHATTLLREHRGDGHVASLVAAGISGRESNVFHTAASAVSEEFMKRSRHYDDDEWQSCRQSLADRGLLDSDGSLTPDGRDLKSQLESTTDALALRVFDGLDDDDLQALFSALTPVARTVIAAGDVPAATPMSARLDF